MIEKVESGRVLWPLLAVLAFGLPGFGRAQLAGIPKPPCDPPLGAIAYGDALDAGASQAVARLFEADQAVRKQAPEAADFAAIQRGDAARRAAALALLEAGRLSTGRDYFHAAMIFQHGNCSAHFELAHRLAAKALELDDYRAAWLSAAAWDRYLLSLGQKQKYGTQYVPVPGDPCHYQLAPVDPGTTDAERRRLGVPPLAEAKARAARFACDAGE